MTLLLLMFLSFSFCVKLAVADTNYVYLGCYQDGNQRILNGLYQELYYDNTIDMCLFYCFSNGYMYGGLEYGSECYCGSLSAPLLPSTDCDITCPGNDSQTCGGAWAMSLYTFNCPCAGLKGEKGDPGVHGIEGVPGRHGPPGLVGRDGIHGIPGVKGDPGVPGLDGSEGPVGPQGESALVYSDGSQEIIQGPKGDRGQKGDPGAPGDNGVGTIIDDEEIPDDPDDTGKLTTYETKDEMLWNIRSHKVGDLAAVVGEPEKSLWIRFSNSWIQVNIGEMLHR